jgi:hypothetical protein
MDGSSHTIVKIEKIKDSTFAMRENNSNCESKNEVLSILIDDINQATNSLETIEKDLHTVNTRQQQK